MAIKVSEKRISPRVECHTPVRYQLRGQSGFDNTITNDVSATGLRFTAERFIPSQAPLMLEISVLERVLRPIGRVVWTSPLPHSDRVQVGVEFIEIDLRERNYLSDFVHMQAN